MAVDVRAFLKATLDQANTESWALQESGYVPSERSTGLSGLIDSVQSGVSSGTAGLMGSLAAYSAENDWDWLENNATWAGRGLQRIAKANEYRGGEGGFWDVANSVAQTIGTSAPSLAAGLAARAGTAAAGAAVGSAFGGVGAIPGAIAGFAVGTAADAGTNDLINSGQMYFDSLDKGLSKEQALANYNQALTDNIPSSLLGAVGDQVSMGFVKAGGKVLGAFANGGGKVAASQVAKAGVNVAIGSALEGYQEAWEDKIANNILEPGSMDDVSMTDPTTWTDEMWDDAKMAALSSGILGGAAHGIRAMANQGSNQATPTIEEGIQPELEATATPTVSDTIETPSMENVVIPDTQIDPTADVMDVNLGSIEPEVLAPKEVNDFAPVLDAMNSRFEKNGYSPEDITARNEAVEMTAQQISDLWDNSDSEKDVAKVKRDAFVSDFENAGLTKPEATEASRKLHKLLLEKQANAARKPAFDGSSMIEKADSLGVTLTEAEKNDLLGENPTPSNVREIDERLTKAAYEDNQNRYKRQLQEQELANRADYGNRYQNNESFGSNYFNARFPESRAEETSYRFSKAMAERKKDMKAGKPNSKTNQLIPYLNRNGITTKEYSKQEISDINAYAKTIDKAKQQVDNGAEISGGLQRVARDTASIQNMDRQTTKILLQFDEESKPEETTEKATMLAKALANVQKKTGLDISKTKAYKAIRALKDKTAYNIIKPQKVKVAQPINNQTVQPTVSDKIKDVQTQAKLTNINQKAEPVTAPNVEEDEITGYEDFNSAIPKVDSIEGLKRSLSASDNTVSVSPEENSTPINETIDEEPKNELVKEEKKERSYSIKDKHNIVYDFVDGHITATEAKKHLITLMKAERTSKKDIQYLKKLESYIDRNIDKENDMYKKRSGVGLDKMENKINEMITKLKGDIDTGKVTQKKYKDSVKNIERAIDTFYSTYPKTLDTHHFEIPEKHKMNQEALAEAALRGEVEIPSYVKNAIIKTPSKIDELTLRWMNKELDRNDTSFRLGVRNKIIYRVLSNEYAKVMEVGPDNMMVTHPRDVQGLAYAIAGSFPDNSMPGKGAEAQKSRHKAMFPNNPQALRSVGNSDKAGMIAFARKYFAGKFNPEKTEVVEKFNPQKEEKKKEISPFTISSVKVPKAGSDEVHVTIKYTPSKELTDQFVKDNIDSLVGQKLEDAFLDAEPENMTVTSIGNGTIEITTIPSLSYKEFGDKYSSGDNKGNMYDKDVRDARDISLEIAVNAANGEAVAFGNDNLNYKEVQAKLDKVFGKGKYNVVSDSDGNNYIKPADKQLTDDMKDNAMFFQYGKDEQGKSIEKADKEEVSAAKSIIEKNDGELKLPNMFAKNIANSIKYYMGDYAGVVFNYLKKAKHLRIRKMSDSNKNYNGLSLLNHGIIEMNEKALTDTSSMPLHELVHDAVYSITNGGEVKNGKQLHTWLSDVIDQAKEEIEHGISTEVRLAGGTGSSVYGRDGDAVQRLRMSGGGTGGIHVPNDGHVVSPDGAGQSHESNWSGTSGIQRNVGEQSRLQTDGELAKTSELDGRNEEYSSDSRLERGAGTARRRILRGSRRAWNNAKNLVEKTTKENVNRKLRTIKKNLTEILDDHEMYHTEKAHAILSNLWAAREIDKKLGLKKNSKDRLYTRLTENPPEYNTNKKFSTIFQEAIAYASHTIAKPAKVAELFNLAQQSEHLRWRSGRDPKMVLTRRVNTNRIFKLFSPEGLPKSSAALTYLSENGAALGPEATDSINNAKHSVVFFKNDVLDRREHNKGDADIMSVTDRTAAIKLKAKETEAMKSGKPFSKEEALKDILREHNGRAGTMGGSNDTVNLLVAVASSTPKTTEEFKAAVQNNYLGTDNSKNILKYYVKLHRMFGTPQERDKIKGLSDVKAARIINKTLSANGEDKIQIKPVFGEGIRGAVFSSLEHIANTGSREFKDVFESHYGKEMPVGAGKLINKLYDQIASHKRPYGEVKFVDNLTVDDVAFIYLDKERDKGMTDEVISKIKALADAHGIPVAVGQRHGGKLGWAVRRKLADTDEAFFQIGKEDPVRDVKAVATEMLEGAKEALKMKRDSNINIKTRDMKQGNIPSAWVKKFFASPAKLIKKYISSATPMIRWAEQAEVEKDKLRRKYIKRWEGIHNKLSDTDKNKFFQVLKDMTDLGREYMQTMRVDYKGRDVFINVSDKDTFFESPELDEAQKTYTDIKNSGKNAYMDFKDGMFRVFGSDNEIKPYSSFEAASKIAKAQTDAIMKSKGYSDNVVKAYSDYRNLMTSIYKDSMDAWHKTGEDPDTKPRYLYAYTPMLHSRYGVYVVTEHEHDSKVYNQYDKVASFHNIPDAKRWARELKVKGNQRIDVIQHGSRFDDTTSVADLYDGYSYDEKYDDVIEQYETNESREARFNRLSNSYTELKKFLENDITNGKRLSAEELIKMLNDTDKLKELNVDRKELAKEIGDANLKELFKQKQAINKDDLIKHLLIGYGNHLKDKYNNKRTGAKGANPDMYDNIVNYMYYKAKQIPNQKFYHKATSLYRDITGNDYKTQFGRNGRGAENDSQEVLNRFISSVVGVPNGFDTKLNESFNETSVGKFAKEHYGDTFITDLMNRGMEATTIAKLGLFRPTAAIAQLGTLLNVYAKAGWNSNFRNALKDATMVTGSNVSMTEKKMFNEIGLDLENTSMETQTLSNRKSLYNLKVGKVRVGKLLEKSMATFNAADKYTRRVAALTAFRKAIKEGKSYEEAVMEASDFVRNTNFDYADKDASKLFTSAGTLGKMILQFKKYPVKEMEFMMDLFSKDGRTEAERRREITRFLASYTVAAGIMGLPMLAVGDELAELLFGKTITGTAKDAMFSWAGKDPVKNNIAQFLAYGALAPTMGVDFSRNIGLGDIVPTSDLAGPTLTTVGKMISSIREQKSMDDIVLAVAHDLSPAMGNYYQFMTGKQRDWKKGIDGREYSTGERLAKLAGFRTVKESVDSDMAYALYQKQTDEKNKKKALIYEYLENPSSVSKEEMRKYGIKGSDIKKAKEQIAKSKLERQEQYLPKKKRTEVTDTADKYNEFYEGL